MKRSVILAALSLSLPFAVTIFGIHKVGTAPASDVHVFPMDPGTVWTYEGLVRWTDQTKPDGADEKHLTWRCEVRRLIEKNEIRGAIISGWPSDLDWSEGQAPPREHLLVEYRGNFYLVDGNKSREIRAKIEQGAKEFGDVLGPDDLFLKWPLREREKFGCDSESMNRPDSMYCWTVDSHDPALPMKIAGIPADQHDSYVLTFRTNPDHMQVVFIPGFGIARYEYHHHGTVAETELTLVSVSRDSLVR